MVHGAQQEPRSEKLGGWTGLVLLCPSWPCVGVEQAGRTQGSCSDRNKRAHCGPVCALHGIVAQESSLPGVVQRCAQCVPTCPSSFLPADLSRGVDLPWQPDSEQRCTRTGERLLGGELCAFLMLREQIPRVRSGHDQRPGCVDDPQTVATLLQVCCLSISEQYLCCVKQLIVPGCLGGSGVHDPKHLRHVHSSVTLVVGLSQRFALGEVFVK